MLAVRAADAAPAAKKTIEVQVEVAEVDNTRASSLGVSWPEAVRAEESSVPGLVSIGPLERLTRLHADVRFLMEEGAAELLANPNLVTDSGTAATFHAGGQIPYATSASLGATSVEFKPYGVVLEVRPRWLDEGRIEMKIRASVSAPDRTNGVLLSGNLVPALFEREVTSHVTVDPGQTVTLAGLVQTQSDQSIRGVPILRKIPVLGALFRWKTRSQRRTTIIMFVTPRVVDT